LSPNIHAAARFHHDQPRLDRIPELFDSPETLDRLCKMSGGHVRNLLILLFNCLQKDDPPFTCSLIDRVLSERRNELGKAITADEWQLLQQVATAKSVRGEEEYQTLLRSLFVFEYCDENGSWFDLNPVLEGTKELQ